MTPETARNYLKRYTDHQLITLVGPLADRVQGFADPVIFVDGGLNKREGKNGIAVGDGDSAEAAMDITLNPDKDFSDLAFALGLIPQHFNRLQLLGFIGDRRDHELLNLGEVSHYLATRTQPGQAQFEQSIVGYSAGQWEIEVYGTFSLITFAPSTVTLSGNCKYPIRTDTVIKPVSSFGLSNEGFGKIMFSTSAPLFVFHNH